MTLYTLYNELSVEFICEAEFTVGISYPLVISLATGAVAKFKRLKFGVKSFKSD